MDDMVKHRDRDAGFHADRGVTGLYTLWPGDADHDWDQRVCGISCVDIAVGELVGGGVGRTAGGVARDVDVGGGGGELHVLGEVVED